VATTYAEIAALLIARIPRRNPIVGGVIVEDLGLVNGTQHVLVLTGGATRQAVYLAPLALQIPGNVFVTRLGQELTAGLAVVTTNYQVPVAGLTNGLTTGGQVLTTGGQVLTTGV
jgi:hypothetical protein